MAQHMKEVGLAARVVAWLRDQGLTVYQEVLTAYGDCVADLVVDVDGRAWVIEVKRSLGITVIRQAAGWTRRVPHVSVAVPESTQPGHLPRGPSADRRFAYGLCKERGIGIIEVPAPTASDLSHLSHLSADDAAAITHHCYEYPIQERVKPEFHHLPANVHNALDDCTEAHQHYCPAGSARGGHITPYRSTMDRIEEYLRRHGPATAWEIIEAVEHHWANSSARHRLRTNIKTVEEPKGWIRIVRDGNAWTFELTGKERT